MQDMFDFFAKLDHSLAAMHEKTTQAAQESPVGDGKERLSDMLKNLQQARGELQEIAADEKRLFDEDEALRQRFSQPEPTPIWEIRPPLPLEKPAKQEPDFGRKVRDRLLNEFTADSARSFAPARHTFDSWLESSHSIALDLKSAGADDGLVREIHQQALIFAPREAIWWACISAVHVLQRINATLPTEEMQQLDSASRWVAGLSPDESVAALVVPNSGVQTIGDAITLSIALANHRAAAFGSRQYELPQEAAAAAILFAGNLVPREQRSEILREVVQLGTDVASGKRLWPAAEQKRTAVKQHEESWSSWLKNSLG